MNFFQTHKYLYIILFFFFFSTKISNIICRTRQSNFPFIPTLDSNATEFQERLSPVFKTQSDPLQSSPPEPWSGRRWSERNLTETALCVTECFCSTDCRTQTPSPDRFQRWRKRRRQRDTAAWAPRRKRRRERRRWGSVCRLGFVGSGRWRRCSGQFRWYGPQREWRDRPPTALLMRRDSSFGLLKSLCRRCLVGHLTPPISFRLSGPSGLRRRAHRSVLRMKGRRVFWYENCIWKLKMKF